MTTTPVSITTPSGMAAMIDGIVDPVTKDLVVDVLSVIDIQHPNILNQKCLDHGFVKIIDVMPRLVPYDVLGCDFRIADSARLSYQLGTRKINSDEGLIDNLTRNRHTSPIEMGELCFHIRLPIFVMRQHVRHRTASLNEESARYSQLASDFYVPEPEHWAINTTADKQATQQGHFTLDQAKELYAAVKSHGARSYALYEAMLHDADKDGPKDSIHATFDEAYDFFLDDIANKVPGLAREQARMVLGVNIYTQCYWKVDLKNLLHYISLRSDPHAQYEIRIFSDAIRSVVAALFPAAWSSFKDHFVDGVNFGREELKIVRAVTEDFDGNNDSAMMNVATLIQNQKWTYRRLEEFSKKLRKSGLVPEIRIEILLKTYKVLAAIDKLAK